MAKPVDLRPFEKALLERAERCLKLAEIELGKGTPKSKIESRAVVLMKLTDQEINKRLKATTKKCGRPTKLLKTERLHIRLPPKVKETIVREAEHEGRTISDYIIRKLKIKADCLHERWGWGEQCKIRICKDCRQSLKPVMSGIVKKHIPFKDCGDPTCRQCN